MSYSIVEEDLNLSTSSDESDESSDSDDINFSDEEDNGKINCTIFFYTKREVYSVMLTSLRC